MSSWAYKRNEKKIQQNLEYFKNDKVRPGGGGGRWRESQSGLTLYMSNLDLHMGTTPSDGGKNNTNNFLDVRSATNGDGYYKVCSSKNNKPV